VAFIFIGCSSKLRNPPFSPIFLKTGVSLKPLLLEKKKFKKSRPRFTIQTCVLGLILFPPLSLAANSIRVNYIVECENAASHKLKIRAKIQGLPAEEIRLVLPDSHVTELELLTVEGGDEKEAEAVQESSDGPLGRNILLRGKPSETVSVKYQISLSDRLSGDRHSFGDGKRCLIYASDLLLGIGQREVRASISFELPPAWIVETNVKNTGKGLFVMGGRQDAIFYLGVAAGQQRTFGQTEVTLVIEPGWEVVEEKIIGILQRQILFQEKTFQDAKRESLFIALLESTKKVGALKILTLENPLGFIALAPTSGLKAAEFEGTFRREVSKGLVQCFFPSLRNSRESTAESFILEYLLLKTDLKTGALSKEQFLQTIAVGFGMTSEAGSRSPKRSNALSRKTVARVALNKEEKISNLFLLDLLLGFYGRSTNSLEQLISSKTNSVVFEKIVEGDPPRSLLHDTGFLIQQRFVFPKGDTDDLSKRLKPFGLVFEMKELGGWSFDLNENFQVERIKVKPEGDDRRLWVGDKIISINNQRILRPVDLVKCRSEMQPGDEFTLFIERSGEVQKIKDRLGRETYCRLETNRLSDLDKQEKLEAFWRREFDQ